MKFLFLTHNNNTHVHEDLLKEMKEDTTLATMVNIAHVSEGTIHSEALSKQYLETIKVSNKQILFTRVSPKADLVAGTSNVLQAEVVYVGTVVQNILLTNAKLMARSVIFVENPIIISLCADLKITLSLDIRGTVPQNRTVQNCKINKDNHDETSMR